MFGYSINYTLIKTFPYYRRITIIQHKWLIINSFTDTGKHSIKWSSWVIFYLKFDPIRISSL